MFINTFINRIKKITIIHKYIVTNNHLSTPSSVSKISCAVPPLQTGMSSRRVHERAVSVSKYRTRTASLLSVLWSVLSSIMMEYGPLRQRAITGDVASVARHRFTIIVVFVRPHLIFFAMALSGNIFGTMPQKWSVMAAGRLCSATK